jgi:hypothetical protein
MDPHFVAVASVVATVSLQEATGFVRDQVALLLQRRQEKVLTADSKLLDGQLRNVAVDKTLVEQERPTLERLRAELEPTANGQPTDPQQARTAFEELRAALERVLGQHVTFAGEDRPRTGTPARPPRTEGQRIFNISGQGNLTIGGDYRDGVINM